MGRYRSRSYSPPHRKRYDDPRDHRSRSYYRDRRSPAPCGLLVRNISLDARPEDLRIPFERFGPLKDVYIPKNYYTGEPRGFGFVKFRHAEDAAEAKEQLHHTLIGGREIRIVFAEENRKTPQEMRRVSHVSRGSLRRRSSSRSPRRRYRSHSRSPRHPVLVSRGPRSSGDYHSSRRARSISRSITPDPRNYGSNRRASRRSRSVSQSRGEQNYKFSPKSSSQRESVRIPYDEKYAGTRSQSTRRETRSPSRSIS